MQTLVRFEPISSTTQPVIPLNVVIKCATNLPMKLIGNYHETSNKVINIVCKISLLKLFPELLGLKHVQPPESYWDRSLALPVKLRQK